MVTNSNTATRRPSRASLARGTVALLLATASASVSVSAEELPITGVTALMLDVTCTQSLNFGVISILDGNQASAVSLAPSSSGELTTSFLVIGHQPGRCEVSNVSSIATIAVSGGGGTWDLATGRLTGATLLMGSDSLDVVIEVDRLTVEAGDVVTQVHIGGRLSVPANFSAFGTYAQTFTLTVTE